MHQFKHLFSSSFCAEEVWFLDIWSGSSIRWRRSAFHEENVTGITFILSFPSPATCPNQGRRAKGDWFQSYVDLDFFAQTFCDFCDPKVFHLFPADTKWPSGKGKDDQNAYFYPNNPLHWAIVSTGCNLFTGLCFCMLWTWSHIFLRGPVDHKER